MSRTGSLPSQDAFRGSVAASPTTVNST
jgi:hypothetical protein